MREQNNTKIQGMLLELSNNVLLFFSGIIVYCNNVWRITQMHLVSLVGECRKGMKKIGNTKKAKQYIDTWYAS